MKLCFATNNANKLAEIRILLGDKFIIKSLKDIACEEDLAEDHDTLEANSLQKAQYVFNKYNTNCFADDTGLEVDTLNGEPGVYSARYAGSQRSNEDNMALLLEKMKGKENRGAQFRTVITLVLPSETKQFEGIVRGKIATEKSGEKGFGYDPIFIPEDHEESFAEMPLEKKNSMSHRARAMTKLINYLKEGKSL